jgi:hypothetical protein
VAAGRAAPPPVGRLRGTTKIQPAPVTVAGRELSRTRRELPWERVEKDYVFDGPAGKKTLADLFDGRSQLVVYHFMFNPDDEWSGACKHCSFIRRRRARSARLQLRDHRAGIARSRRRIRPLQERAGEIFRTYSTFARGIDFLNAAYNYLDLVPLGRGEDGLPNQLRLRRVQRRGRSLDVERAVAESKLVAAERIADHVADARAHQLRAELADDCPQRRLPRARQPVRPELVRDPVARQRLPVLDREHREHQPPWFPGRSRSCSTFPVGFDGHAAGDVDAHARTIAPRRWSTWS